MRKYTRKRPQVQIIENVHELCRLCLEKAEELVPIYNTENDACEALALRIMICVGLEMVRQDNLPNGICNVCTDELKRYYAFRKKCEASYQKLKTHLLAVKERECKITLEKDKEIEENDLKKENDSKYVQSDQINLISLGLNGGLPTSMGNIQFIQPKTQSVSNLPTLNINTETLAQLQALHKLNTANSFPKLKDEVTHIKTKHVQSLSGVKDSRSLISNNAFEIDNRTLNASNPVHLISQRSPEENSPLLPTGSSSLLKKDKPTSTDKRVTIDTSLITPVIEKLKTESVQVKKEEASPGIAAFLSGLLLELGGMSQQGSKIQVVDETLKDIEIETGDGDTVGLELMELDDQELQAEEQKESSSLDNSNNKINCSGSVLFPGTVCGACGRRLGSRGALRRHARAHAPALPHAPARPHACPRCPRAFAQRAVLARHLLLHQERPFKCTHPSCTKSFTQRAALTAHARAHTPAAARPLALHGCPLCAKVFLHASGLSRHMLNHNGVTFPCSTCGRQFQDKSSLLRHERGMPCRTKGKKNT